MMYAKPEIFLMFVIVAAAIASIARRALRRCRQRLGPDNQPLCGACGYNTRGLSTLICPECGSDFRIVGIGQSTTRASHRIAAFLLCAAGVLAMLYFLNRPLVRLVWPMLPTSASFDNRVTATSAAYPNRKFKIFSLGRIEPFGNQPPPVKIEMEIDIGGVTRRFAMTYFPPRNAYTYQHGKIISGDDFGPDAVLKWMTSVDRVTPDEPNNVVITPDAATRVEAARVAGLARKVGRGMRVQEPYRTSTLGWVGTGGGSRRTSSSGGAIFARFDQSYSGNAARPPDGAAEIIRDVLLLMAVIVIIALLRAIVFPRRAASSLTSPTAHG